MFRLIVNHLQSVKNVKENLEFLYVFVDFMMAQNDSKYLSIL